MNKATAEKILNLKGDYTVYDVRNAYRILMTNGNPLDDGKAREAYDLLSTEMGAAVPAGRPNLDVDPEFLSRTVRNVVNKSAEADKLAIYEFDAPPWTPAPYRKVRGIVQHAPYRVLLFVLANLGWVAQQSFAFDSAGAFVLAWLFLNVAFVNLIFPFVTRPIRRALIDFVDAYFGVSWERTSTGLACVHNGTIARN